MPVSPLLVQPSLTPQPGVRPVGGQVLHREQRAGREARFWCYTNWRLLCRRPQLAGTITRKHSMRERARHVPHSASPGPAFPESRSRGGHRHPTSICGHEHRPWEDPVDSSDVRGSHLPKAHAERGGHPESPPKAHAERGGHPESGGPK